MPDRDLDLRLLAACAIAREAGKLAYDYFEQRAQLEIEHKGLQDLVSLADRAVEDLIRARLGGAFPEDDLLGEEGGGAARRPGAGLWVIDPIDGTANFLRGMPYWCVALAYVTGDRVEIGVTYDPVHDDLFWARRGGGAHRNQAPIRVSGATDPRRAVVGSTFTFKMKIESYIALIEGILLAGADHRRMGSTALMMCHVADGRLDGCVTGYCNAWDVIGGLLLVEEAGGVASHFIADNGLMAAGSALACTPGLQETLAQIRAPAH
ncbi:MAG: inositol monophosphatase family protein [Geminicoccaceae bacterium]